MNSQLSLKNSKNRQLNEKMIFYIKNSILVASSTSVNWSIFNAGNLSNTVYMLAKMYSR